MGSKRYILPLYGLILFVAVYGFLGKQISIWDGYGMPYSAADCLALLRQPYITGIFYMPLTIGLILGNEDSYLRKAFITAYVQRKRVWRHQCGRIIKNSLYSSLYFAAVSIVLSALSSGQWINWGSRYSIFFVELKKVYHGSFLFVIFLFFYFTWFKTTLLSLFLLTVEWFGCKKIFGWLVIVCLTVIEWCFSNSLVFFRLFALSYFDFKYKYGLAGILVLSVLLLFAVYKIGENAVEGREIYFG